MANTYKALSTVTVGAGGAASISFTNIPQTYTDLVLVTSLRGATTGNLSSIFFNINSMGGTSYNVTGLQGSGSSLTTATTTYAVAGQLNGGGTTANTFSNNSFYFPNYTNNTLNKVFITDSAVENNSATVASIDWQTSVVGTTAPITSITISDGSSGLNFVQYSSATLYGVFNADVSSAPATPTIGTATATGQTTATVAFTPVSNAASYTVTSSPGSITATGTSSPITVTGLSAGTSYTFTIRSNNPIGSSAASAASNSITTDSINLLTVAYGTNLSATSTDGITWTSRTMPSTRDWYALWYDNGRFVIQGNGSTVGAYSADGITWTTTTLPTSSAWVQTGFGNSRWVTQGQNQPSAFAVSTDNGATWSSATGGSGWAGSSSVFGNGVFVSTETQANAGTNAWYSTNGTSWTNGGSLGATTGWGRGYYNASAGGFIITANTSTNYVSQSTTGTGSWTLRTLPATANWGGALAYGNGVWSYLTNTAAASSTDGITWTSRTTPAAVGFGTMRYSTALNLFVAVANGNVAYTSSTGTGSWTTRTLPSSSNWASVSSNG